MPSARTVVSEDIALAQAGDHPAFGRLFHAHAPRVRALASWLGHETDADDITQDVFVLVWRKLRSFDGHSAFATWLHRVAINAIISRRRQDRTSTWASLSDVDDALPGTAPDDRVALDDLIARLKPELRDVFVLHDVEGYGHDEIATLLRIPAGTSGSRLHRARQLLRAGMNVTA